MLWCRKVGSHFNSMKGEKKTAPATPATAPATASAVIPIVTPSFNVELVDDDDLPTTPPLFTIAKTATAPEMKNSSNSYYNLFVLPDKLKMKKERFTTNVAAAAAASSWQDLQRDDDDDDDDDDIGTGDVPTPTPTVTKVEHHQEQQPSPRNDSSSSCNEDKGAAAAATTLPNKEQEQGVARERGGLNLLEDMDHDDSTSSSVDTTTTIYEDWHDKANDHSLRKKVMINIYKALITELNNTNMYSDEWKRKLPQLVHRLESIHYHKSPTRDVYLDINPKKMKKSWKCLAKSI